MVELSERNRLSKRNLIGYALGDLGGCMTFAIMGSFLTPYYTEVAGLSTTAVAGMYLVLKIWDAINDPLMGALMDKLFARTRSGSGKFRPWMRRASPLLFIMAILMFTAPTYMDGAAKLLLAFVTYLLYEASYTMFNVPYGSLLSSMAGNDVERASLSSARGLGSLIGNLLPVMVFPLIIQGMSSNLALGYAAGVTGCAAVGLVACLLSCKWTTEHVIAQEEEEGSIKVSDILVVFRRNRAFVALCLQGLFYCIGQYFGTTLSVYMFRDVLHALPMMSAMTVVSTLMSIPFLTSGPKLAQRFGLEASVRVTQLVSVVLYVALFATLTVTTNIWVFMVLFAFAQGFSGFTVLQQWGMVGEAIDYNELVTGKRTEGSIYGTFNLMRRVGQAIGSSGSMALLGAVGYVANAATQTPQAMLGISALVVLVPGLCMLGCWAALRFAWNITPAIRVQIDALKNKTASDN